MRVVRLNSEARLRSGPFYPHVNGFLEALRSQEYAPGTLRLKRLGVAELSRWLHRHHVKLAGFNEEELDAFLRGRRRYRAVGGMRRTGVQLLHHLRSHGLLEARPPRPPSPVDDMISNFGNYLRAERGVGEITIGVYSRLIRPFLTERSTRCERPSRTAGFWPVARRSHRSSAPKARQRRA